MRVSMAATGTTVVLDLQDNEAKVITTLEELDRHIRAMQKAREWLANELRRKEAEKVAQAK